MSLSMRFANLYSGRLRARQEVQEVDAMGQNDWIENRFCLPPDGQIVQTKIDDDRGERNVQDLKRIGALWFMPDGSMYVYYTPTHWRCR
jgi:hypothetical protein